MSVSDPVRRARPLRVLVVGVGHMGLSHAEAYDRMEGYELAGLCARSIAARTDLPPAWAHVPRYADFHEALASVRPDVVAVCTWPNTHAEYAIAAIAAGAHVFLEKPVAQTVAEAEAVVAAAVEHDRKLLVGLAPPHSPMWRRLTELAQGLGKPLVMRMNLNQQSIGKSWNWHRNLMESASPIVDCAIHYVDAMCTITGARPVRVHAIGARLSDEIAPEMYNYGQLQIVFDDGSIGWFEAGWGPMMSQESFFVRDVIGPRGSVSVHDPDPVLPTRAGATVATSSDIRTHGRVLPLRLHHAALGPGNEVLHGDEEIEIDERPDHVGLCVRKQAYLLDAILTDRDLTGDMRRAVDGMRVVMAADESIRTGALVHLAEPDPAPRPPRTS